MNKNYISNNRLFNCLLYAIIGIMLIIFKSGSLGILMTIIGVLLMIMGVIDITNRQDKTTGIIELIIGIAIIVCGWTIADVVLLVFGILLILKGSIELYHTYKLGINYMLSPIVNIVIGVILVVARWTLIDVFCVVAGVIFIINAALILLGKQVK